LTDDYKKFTKQFKELQNKFKRFEKSDENRFNEIWTMNEHEVRALINKIIQADRVIHMQQLGINWEPPSDPIFGFNAEKSGAASQANNTSIMDSSKHGQSKSEFEGDQSVVTGTQGGANSSAIQQYDYKVSIGRIKNVFKLLITECPFLIDDKAMTESAGKPIKEQFTIQIDSIRKSLGIDNMDDVELLVLTFYEFQEALKNETQQASNPEGEQHSDEHLSNGGARKGLAPKASNHAVNLTEEKKEEVDEELLVIDNDDIVGVLKDFHRKREERANNAELLGNPRMKKRSNFETEEQKKERIKREERIFWEKMTTVLDDKKLSTWKALDKALSKYYQLLVDRQNLIEETGLLNQQNEELKTLLNQYLQAGVNHELHVPPTQVIRLDI